MLGCDYCYCFHHGEVVLSTERGMALLDAGANTNGLKPLKKPFMDSKRMFPCGIRLFTRIAELVRVEQFNDGRVKLWKCYRLWAKPSGIVSNIIARKTMIYLVRIDQIRRRYSFEQYIFWKYRRFDKYWGVHQNISKSRRFLWEYWN